MKRLGSPFYTLLINEAILDRSVTIRNCKMRSGEREVNLHHSASYYSLYFTEDRLFMPPVQIVRGNGSPSETEPEPYPQGSTMHVFTAPRGREHYCGEKALVRLERVLLSELRIQQSAISMLSFLFHKISCLLTTLLSA